MEFTAAAVAANEALELPEGTVIVPGTVTLELLLDSATETPALGAVPPKVTVQETDAGPVTAPEAQVRALSGGVVGLTDIEPPVPNTETVEPAGFETTTELRETGIEGSGALAETFRVADATVPLPIAFWFMP
jgi:hypothetical protein